MAMVVVVSDNHGKRKVIENIYNAFKNDAIAFIHCGDSEMTPIELKDWHVVGGNNDYDGFEDELIVNVAGIRIFVCHGHLNSYFNREQELVQLAKKHNCQIVCSGHTHMMVFKKIDDIYFINPGSLRYNRDGSLPSFAIISFSKLDLSDISVQFFKGSDYEK